jgi:hypothetical protein
MLLIENWIAKSTHKLMTSNDLPVSYENYPVNGIAKNSIVTGICGYFGTYVQC